MMKENLFFFKYLPFVTLCYALRCYVPKSPRKGKAAWADIARAKF